MKFETVPVAEARGAILVHSLRAGGRVLKKGRVLTAVEIAQLADAGVAEVTVARLEDGDVGEDEAAARVAQALAGARIRVGAAFTGRANLYATEAGVVVLNASSIEAANLLDESVTIATVPPYAVVAKDDMVATIKVIPFAAPEEIVRAVRRIAKAAPMSIAPFVPQKAALISTTLPGQKPGLFAKTKSALEARLAPFGSTLIFDAEYRHDAPAVAAGLRAAKAKGAELFFVIGASAISDRRDVVPAGIVAAGGAITHFGMPVDPGNLLLLGELDGRPVVGLPGCARSPKINGFDFVLQRLAAGLRVDKHDVMSMGVGGLLKEIPGRPQPRAADEEPMRAPRIAGVVLAAGMSSRMGSNKLLAAVDGVPLIRRTVEAVVAAHVRPVIVVTGHQAKEVEDALAGLPVQFVFNPRYAEGQSTSLRLGVQAVPESADGVFVILGDMPEISAVLLDRMIAGFAPAEGRAICIATAGGKRGNPVLWARRFIPEMEGVTGDTGAKHLIARYDEAVCEIEADPAVLRDVDTPEALDALRARVKSGRSE
jgi:molybdenum cofactor cytidylyltransferase